MLYVFPESFLLPAPMLRCFLIFFCSNGARKDIRKNDKDTCGRNYITINICAHLSIISDVQHHRPWIHKIFPCRKLRIFSAFFSRRSDSSPFDSASSTIAQQHIYIEYSNFLILNISHQRILATILLIVTITYSLPSVMIALPLRCFFEHFFSLFLMLRTTPVRYV